MSNPGTWRRIALWVAVATVTVGGVGFAALAALEGVASAGDRFAATDWRWIAAGSALWTVALAVQAERWRPLIPAEGIGPGELALVVIGTNVLNITLPGPAGEVAAAWYLRRRWGVPVAVGLASAILARLLALGLLGVLALGLGWLAPGAAGPLRTTLVLVLAAVGLGFGLVARWPRRVLGTAARLPMPGRVRARVAGMGEALGALEGLDARRWARAVGWAVVNVGVLWAGVHTGFWAVGADPDPVALLLTHVLASLGVVVAVMVPGGFGAVEAIWVGMHQTLGVTVEDAVIGAVALRWIQLGSIVISALPLAWVARRIDLGAAAAPPVDDAAPPEKE